MYEEDHEHPYFLIITPIILRYEQPGSLMISL